MGLDLPYTRDTRGRKILRFNAEKLRSFAAGVGKEQGDIVEQIAIAICRGNAPTYLLDLLADKYDDAFIYTLGEYVDRPVTYYGDRNAIMKYHKLEFQLGASQVEHTLDATLDGRAYRCFGNEYCDWTHVRVPPPLCTHLKQDEEYNMPTVAAPRVWWDEATGSYACRTPYNENFIMFIKLVDKEDKKWDAELKLWFFSPRVIDRVKDKIQRVYGSCDFVGPNTAPRLSVGLPSDSFAKFARLVGKDAMRRAYFDAAKRFHADVGGQGDHMTELNVLWKDIEEALK